MKTSELTNAALDWAVESCEGYGDRYLEHWRMGGDKRFIYCDVTHCPSTNWAQGGPIIEREDINVTRRTIAEITESRQEVYRKDGWTAFTTSSAYWMTPIRCYGPTPLVAAMRCYVASKLGDDVEIPEELK